VKIVVVPVVPLFAQFLTIALQSAPSGTPMQVHFCVLTSQEKPADPPTPIIAASAFIAKTVPAATANANMTDRKRFFSGRRN
jgi:hypothetical protein